MIQRLLRNTCFLVLFGACASAQQKAAFTDQEKPIVQQLRTLRALPDDVRARTTKDLALQIRNLPQSPKRLSLATGLAGLSTEGDFGHDTLQEVATTLATVLQQQPAPAKAGEPAYPYVELAELVKYEHVQASLEDPQFAAAMKQLDAENADRASADFTLSDLHGKSWTLRQLPGKVVLVNFWATWCPPCRKELPDLETLYERFKDQGLVVLAISDEDASKVRSYIAARTITFPVLLDAGRTVNTTFHIAGIPKTFIYDRDGKLAAQAIDMRTQKQFLEMLAQAGLH